MKVKHRARTSAVSGISTELRPRLKITSPPLRREEGRRRLPPSLAAHRSLGAEVEGAGPALGLQLRSLLAALVAGGAVLAVVHAPALRNSSSSMGTVQRGAASEVWQRWETGRRPLARVQGALHPPAPGRQGCCCASSWWRRRHRVGRQGRRPPPQEQQEGQRLQAGEQAGGQPGDGVGD